MQIKLAGIINESIVDGPGIRTVLFTQGCSHNCFNCHNPATHNPEGGRLYDIEDLCTDIIKNCRTKLITISGGEPLQQHLQLWVLTRLLKQFDFNVWVYTGFTYEYIQQNDWLKMSLDYIDTIVDGPYIDSRRDLTLKFRGSNNQRIIDMRKSGKKLVEHQIYY